MSMPPKDFTVAIVGGGMCGLACAIGLVKAGIQVNVFEATPKFDEVGAGVGLGANALRALAGLGLLEAVVKKAEQSQPNQRLFMFVSGAGNHEEVYDYADSSGEEGHKGIGIYRPAFLDAIMPMLDPSITHFNKRCISVELGSSQRPLIRFSDGTAHSADIIIGADGIKSSVRNGVFDKDKTCLRFSGTYAYRGLVAMDTLKAAGVQTKVESRPYCWVGLDKHIITFPIQNDTMLNVVAFSRTKPEDDTLFPEKPHPWVEAVPQDELLEKYEGWGPDAMTILRHLKNPSRWSIHTILPPLPSFVNGRVVLVGDAAHAMVPHLGAGVGQGFEDVYALCRLLGHSATTKSNLDSILAIYNELRPARANMVLERSLKMGEIYENYGPDNYGTVDMSGHLAGMWEPVWNHDLEAQVSTAIEGMARIQAKY